MAQITINLNDAKLDEFKKGFLVFNPIPKDDDGNPTMTFEQHIKQILKNELITMYQAGKTKLVAEAVLVDNDIIT